MWDAIAVGLVVLVAAGVGVRWLYRQAAGRESGCATCGADCPTCCPAPPVGIGDLRTGEDTDSPDRQATDKSA
jgi:hypothetical protein